MNYLITGITGFAGPHLANLLIKNKHNVYGLINCSNGRENDIRDVVKDDEYNSINWVYSDLKNLRNLQNIFKEKQFDGVFHLAAQSHPPTSFVDPLGTMETNVIGSANLIQCISDLQPKCKLMFCSTSRYMEILVVMEKKLTSMILFYHQIHMVVLKQHRPIYARKNNK